MANKRNTPDNEEKHYMTLYLDNDETLRCEIVNIFTVSGRDYISLLPLNDKGVNETGEVYLYRYVVKDGEPQVDNIIDDDEYEAVADAFDEYLDDLEFEDLGDID